MADKIIICPNCKTKLDASTAAPGTALVCGKCKVTVASAVPTEDLEGKTLGGYRILKKIGRGGMGFVYLAEQISLGRKVALKALKTPHLAAEFKREAMAAGSVSHPNVVAIYDIGEAKGVTFIVMEYVDGVSLRGLLAKSGALPLPQGMAIAKQMLSALARAHREGFLHRDIKPENILVNSEGLVKVADFGLAQLLDAACSERAERAAWGGAGWKPPRRGTPPYLSPEQARGQACDARSDLYAAGVTLFETFSGVRPFDAKTPREILQRAMSEPMPTLSIANPSAPARLSDLIARLCAKEPADRPSDAESALRELESIEEQIKSGESSVFAGDAWQRAYHDAEEEMISLSRAAARKASSPLWPVVATAGVAGVALVVVVVVFLWGGGEKPPEPRPSPATPPPVAAPREEPNVERRRAAAKDALDRADAYAQANPKDYAAIISYYSDVAVTGAGTEEAEIARRRMQETEARWLEDGREQVKAIREQAEKLMQQDDFAAAANLCHPPKGYRGIGIDSDLRELREQITERAIRRVEEVNRNFQVAMADGDFDVAKQALDAARRIGSPGAERFLKENQPRFDRRMADARQEWAGKAAAEFFTFLEKANDWAKDRKYEEAAALLKTAAQDPRNASIRPDLEKESEGLASAQRTFQSALGHLTRNAGMTVRVKGILGPFREIRDGRIYIETPGRPIFEPVAELSYKEVARLAEQAYAALPDKERRLAVGLFLLYDQRFREAEKELKAAEQFGADVAFYLKRLDLASANRWEEARRDAKARFALDRLRESRRRLQWQDVLTWISALHEVADSAWVKDNRDEIESALREARSALGDM